MFSFRFIIVDSTCVHVFVGDIRKNVSHKRTLIPFKKDERTFEDMNNCCAKIPRLSAAAAVAAENP